MMNIMYAHSLSNHQHARVILSFHQADNFYLSKGLVVVKMKGVV